MTRKMIVAFLLFAGLMTIASCSDNKPATGGMKTVDVQLKNPPDEQMAAAGKEIFNSKCQSCHRLSAERMIGPGLKDITKRRKPEWIINMISNIDYMLEQDPVAGQLLEEYRTRMPNQNVDTDDARKVLEFLRTATD